MNFQFPDLGEGIHEGEIVRWHVEEGERVRENDILVEVETDKAVVEIPSPCGGVVESVPYDPGDIVEVGETLVVIRTDEDAKDDPETPQQEPGTTTVVGELAEDEDETDTTSRDGDEPVKATPATRRLARELDVSLDQVDGTGPEGRVTSEDVRREAGAAESEGDEQRTRSNEYGTVTVQPLRGVRRSVADAMDTSHREIPRATHMDTADVTEIERELESINETRPTAITLTSVLGAAVLDVLPDHPGVNARFDGESRTILRRQYYNLGVSVDTKDGLIVPVVKHADRYSLPELNAEIHRLIRAARDRALELEELRDATFTVTNIGAVGGRWGIAQVPSDQAAILATGRVESRPRVVGDDIVPRSILPLSVSFDHRVLDGADVARFTNDLVDRLQDEGFLQAVD